MFQAAQLEEQEPQTTQILDLDGSDSDDDSLEEEFEGERGRRSLASIFDKDDEILEVDAEMQDETLLVNHFPRDSTSLNHLLSNKIA